MTKEQIQQLPTPRTNTLFNKNVFNNKITVEQMCLNLEAHARSLEQQLEAIKVVAEKLALQLQSFDYGEPDSDGCAIRQSLNDHTTTFKALEEMNK